ncbi:ArsR/SmtB family transcription factor [Oceanobacillus iheyensis]|uniref:ArsR/SmtB family transcription factor n=1 Tax=Oceanobacillus iheyensis TaxID=182710 RepID=UPI0036280D94
MDILNWSSTKENHIHVTMDHSIIHEAVLGIAAITNKPLLSTLEKESEFKKLRKDLSSTLLHELNYLETHNTWKALLLLIHTWNIQHIDEFEDRISETPDVELRYNVIPYIGKKYEENREKAARGEKESVKLFEKATSNILTGYVTFIVNCEINQFKKHLINVLKLWLEEVVYPSQDIIEAVLSRDIKSKKLVKQQKDSLSFIQWVLDDQKFRLEDAETNIILIPQITYRPWVIYLELPSYQVFYYPVTNESIHPEDMLVPDYRMLQVFKMLGDDTRLRLMKLLYERDYSLSELASKTNIGKTTIHHHLKLMRSTRILETNQSKYHLNQDILHKNWNKLEDYLHEK